MQQLFPNVWRDVDRGRAQGDDLPLAAGPFQPVHVILGAEAEKLLQARAVRIQPAALLQQFVAVAPLVKSVRQHGHRLAQREQRAVHPRLGKALLAQPDEGLLGEQAFAEKSEELLRCVQRVLDQLFLARPAEPVKQAALLRRIPEIF